MKRSLTALVLTTAFTSTAALAEVVPPPAKIVNCLIKEGDRIEYKGKCGFDSFDRNGSFVLTNVKGEFYPFYRTTMGTMSLISVDLGRKEITRSYDDGEYIPSPGLRRNPKNKACWIDGMDYMEVCAWK